MRSSSSHPKLVSRSILVFGSICIIAVLLVIPFEIGKSAAQVNNLQRKSEKPARPQLDVQRRRELWKLYDRLQAGESICNSQFEIQNSLTNCSDQGYRPARG